MTPFSAGDGVAVPGVEIMTPSKGNLAVQQAELEVPSVPLRSKLNRGMLPISSDLKLKTCLAARFLMKCRSWL